MKNTTFKRIISMVLVCMMLVGTLAGISVSADAETTVEFVSNNVLYDENLKLMYAVQATNAPEGATIVVTLSDGENTYETVPATEKQADGAPEGATVVVSKYGVPAQNIDTVLTATAQVIAADGEVLAETTKDYSVLEYLNERLYVSADATDAQKEMYNALIAYAAAADAVINGADSISTLAYVVLNGKGGMYTIGDTITLTTDLVAGEGEEIVWTVNGEKHTEATYTVAAGFANIVAEVVEITDIDTSIATALAAENGAAVVVSGTVISIGTAWNNANANMSATIQDAAGDTLYLYKLATEVAEGDVITVTGTMGTYGGKRQVVAGATAEITGQGEVPEPAVMTIPQALASTTYGIKVIVSGTVVGNYNGSAKSVYIQDEEGNQLLVYNMSTTGIYIGDQITVTGLIDYYNGIQIAAGATAVVNVTHTCVPTEATCTSASVCSSCGKEFAPALTHPTDENGDGICDNCGVSTSVSTATETLAIIANTGVVGTDTISWTGSAITFTNNKATSSNDIRTSDSNHFRCYVGSEVVISTNNGQKMTQIQIVAQSASYAAGFVTSITAAGLTATAEGTIVTITVENAESISFSITSEGKQARLTEIIVTYAE